MDKDEILHAVQVDPDNIVCKTCKYKNQGQSYPHFTKAHCGIYREDITTKPMNILFDGANCVFYESE